jgi:serine/threonine protein kinase
VFNPPPLHYRDSAELVRTIFGAVAYLHKCGIVHRDLKPENLLFRDPSEDADIMICDFGLSRVIDSDKIALLTEICGTPGVSPNLSHLTSSVLNPDDFSTWRQRSS